MSTLLRENTHSVADLTTTVFGEALTLEQVAARVGLDELVAGHPNVEEGAAEADRQLWLGSVGYERHRDSALFASHLRKAGVERLIDVRELPISRRRGYAKTALSETLASEKIEYVHLRGLGNPKQYRDLYKSGRVREGRSGYQQFLLGERRAELAELVPLLNEKRCALMCVEHDQRICHRWVIIQALERELGVDLDVVQIG